MMSFPGTRTPGAPTSRRPLAIRSPLPVVLAVISLLLLGPGAAPAEACTCIPNPPPRQALEQADAVFAGRVVSIAGRETGEGEGDDGPGASRFFPRLEVVLQLEKIWKGAQELTGDDPTDATVTVTTASQSAACGYGFQVEGRYLVYAFRQRMEEAGEPEWTTSLCSRNAPIGKAAEDLEALGPPEWAVER